MIHNQDQSAFPFARAASLMTIAAAIVAGAATLICRATGHADSVAPMLAAALACLLAGIAGLAPIVWRTRISPDGAAQGFMIGVMLRLLLTLGLTALIATSTAISARLLVGWTAAWYLILLAVETALVAEYLKRQGTGPAPEAIR